jgi:hemerythrin-like domain-containing protein
MDRIANIIRADHRELALCYRRIVDAVDEDEQTRHQNQFTWELARHLVGEELVIFPAMERNVRDESVDEQQLQRPHPHQKVSLFGAHFIILPLPYLC